MGDLSKYFSKDELECKCGCGACDIHGDLLHVLDSIRGMYGAPIKIVSGYRCEAHNKTIGGESNSAHIRGMAVDISVTTSNQRFVLHGLALGFGIRRVGLGKTFIHIDVDPGLPQNVEWLYS